MPWGDGTGPMGFGPMTGRAAGFCAGFAVPGYANPYRGRGRGLGRHWRSGWGRFPYAPFRFYGGPVMAEPTVEEEKMLLQEQVELLEAELKSLKNRLKDMEQGSEG
ncbi:MAG: DUF5320 domain-containing protein [bacterium]